MSQISYQLDERRQKMYIKTYLVLCLVLLLSMGFFTFRKWQEYNLSRIGVTQNQEFIEALRVKVIDEQNIYDQEKNSFDQLNKEVEKKLSTIFPVDDNYTVLTRQIDAYEQLLAKRSDPFEISNIDYQTEVVGDFYSYLPFRMNIRSSRDNFTKFLHLIETSGAINDNIRLMDVASIRLNFGDESVGNEEVISFSVQINAYFQK